MNHIPNQKIDSAELIQMVTDMVLRQIQSSKEQAALSPKEADQQTAASSEPAFIIEQKVVTTDLLPAGWDSAKEIQFAKNSIVTPAVIDLLRDRKILFRFEGQTPEKPLPAFGTPKTGKNENPKAVAQQQSGDHARGTVTVEADLEQGFGWLEKLCQTFELKFENSNSHGDFRNGKHLIVSENPFQTQKRLSESENLHAIVGCQNASETFDRMAYSNILIVSSSTTSWQIKQILRGWDQIGCVC